MTISLPSAIGLDFGTTNSVVALAQQPGAADMLLFDGPAAPGAVFRSALCLWEEEGEPQGLASEAGPWAIAEYLAFPQGSRFLQSFKSVAANASFEYASVFERRFRFEDLGRLFLGKMSGRARGALNGKTARCLRCCPRLPLRR